MKKIIFVVTIILLILLSVFIYNRKYEIFNNVDYISNHPGDNREMFSRFLTKISKNEKSIILMTIFTDEGDNIYHRIEYNGEYFELIVDTRQDSFGPKKVYKTKYLSIEERVEEANGAKISYYVLINDEEEFSLIYLLNGW